MMRTFIFFLARILTQIFLECIFKVSKHTLPFRFVFKSRALTKNYFTSSMFRFFAIACSQIWICRGTQRQFLENICSEDDLKWYYKMALLPILNGFLHWKGHPEFLGAFSFLAEIFEKVSFDPYNFHITRLSARNPNRWKILGDKNMPISTV